MAGPFLVRVEGVKAPVKRYLALFTCALYRIIHLEATASLSTSSFLAAFERFVSRNARPTTMISDQGTLFVAADRELKSLSSFLSQEGLHRAHPDIEWNFNVPSAPHYGGFVERMIQSAKRAMYTVMGPSQLTDEEFGTVLTKVESMLNSRPLAKECSPDPKDPDILTPAHFKIGTAIKDVVVSPRDEPLPSHLRWYHVQGVLDRVWQRFCEEILPHYQPLNEWASPKRDMQAGDLVLNLDNKSRGRWPLTKVKGVHKSEVDGRVRSVVIHFKGRDYERSVHKLLRVEAMSVWESLRSKSRSL